MKKLKLTKLIAILLTAASVLSANPVEVSAEWKSNSTGWWYAENNSYAIGWENIDGKWYYFDQSGYMVHDTTIDGYKIGEDGAWITTSTVLGIDTSINDESSFGFDGSFNEITGKTGTITGYNGTDTSIFIPSIINGISVTSIGTFSFIGNYNLISITIPNTVTTIESQAFHGCSNLISVTIPSSVIDVGYLAFYGCDNAIFYVGNENIKQLLINTSHIDINKIIVSP